MPNTTLIIMGVSGVGKSTVARDLAHRLNATYIEADDFHSAENVAAMKAGKPLTDAMRMPWLKTVADQVSHVHRTAPDNHVILACSALKRSYRKTLSNEDNETCFIHLTAPRALIHERISSRSDHFMPADLLDSQLATLEPLTQKENFVEIDVSGTVAEIVAEIIKRLQL